MGDNIERIAQRFYQHMFHAHPELLDGIFNRSVYVWYERGAEGTLPVDGVFAGQMDLSQVDLPAGAGYYMCGPLPFMQALRSALVERGVPPRDIQYELFGPDLWQADLLTEPAPGATSLTPVR